MFKRENGISIRMNFSYTDYVRYENRHSQVVQGNNNDKVQKHEMFLVGMHTCLLQ